MWRRSNVPVTVRNPYALFTLAISSAQTFSFDSPFCWTFRKTQILIRAYPVRTEDCFCHLKFRFWLLVFMSFRCIKSNFEADV